MCRNSGVCEPRRRRRRIARRRGRLPWWRGQCSLRRGQLRRRRIPQWRGVTPGRWVLAWLLQRTGFRICEIWWEHFSLFQRPSKHGSKWRPALFKFFVRATRCSRWQLAFVWWRFRQSQQRIASIRGQRLRQHGWRLASFRRESIRIRWCNQELLRSRPRRLGKHAGVAQRGFRLSRAL